MADCQIVPSETLQVVRLDYQADMKVLMVGQETAA